MEIRELLSFEIKQNYVDSMGQKFAFFRISPPNFTTLDENDKQRYRADFENFLRNIENFSINVFAMDKTVNLDANRKYIENFDEKYDYIQKALLENLDNIEANSGNTQRSYYFVIRYKENSEASELTELLKVNGFHCTLAEYDELVSIMRCFLLREFIDQPIYGGQDEE